MTTRKAVAVPGVLFGLAVLCVLLPLPVARVGCEWVAGHGDGPPGVASTSEWETHCSPPPAQPTGIEYGIAAVLLAAAVAIGATALWRIGRRRVATALAGATLIVSGLAIAVGPVHIFERDASAGGVAHLCSAEAMAARMPGATRIVIDCPGPRLQRYPAAGAVLVVAGLGLLWVGRRLAQDPGVHGQGTEQLAL